MTACAWFAGCDRAAEGTLPHAGLGELPACARCADRVDMAEALRPFASAEAADAEDACGCAGPYLAMACVCDDADEDEGPTVRIPYGRAHLTSDEVWAMIHAREGVREISDACAATIAAWFQSPAGSGATFAALASNRPVTVTALHDAIAAERMALPSYAGSGPGTDALALGMLATWAMNGADAPA